MTPDPVTISPSTPIGKLARSMLDAHIHRVIVLEVERRLIGVVTSTDKYVREVRQAGLDLNAPPVFARTEK
jgi:CBS domain-containing protein